MQEEAAKVRAQLNSILEQSQAERMNAQNELRIANNKINDHVAMVSCCCARPVAHHDTIDCAVVPYISLVFSCY
jgi:hypothetical protein